MVAVTESLPVDLEALAEQVAQALQQEAERYSAPGQAPKIDLSAVQFSCVIDRSNQQPGYEGVWRNASNARCGLLTINSDASLYAEYDLFCAHPSDPRWFVEMVTAWGSAESIRCEAQLAEALQ